MSKRFKQLSHSLYECKYHLVFCPKYRYRVLDSEIGQFVQRQLEQLLRQKEQTEVIELNVQKDHVHLVASIPPKYAVSDLMGFLKGKSAIRIHREHLGRQRGFTGFHFWVRGYCVSTVGLDEQVVREYIRNQEAEEKRQEQLYLGGLQPPSSKK